MKLDRRHKLALREHERHMRRLLVDLQSESASLDRALRVRDIRRGEAYRKGWSFDLLMRKGHR